MFRFDSRIAALRARFEDMRRFIRTETGAVTVDWVVMAAAAVGLGLGAVASVRSGALSLGEGVGTSLSSATVADLSGDGSGGGGGAPWQAGQWNRHNPGIYDSYSQWMSGFSDDNLLAHMENMAQFADMPPGSGHPYDTYHDEYHIARDEAISRGLIPST